MNLSKLSRGLMHRMQRSSSSSKTRFFSSSLVFTSTTATKTATSTTTRMFPMAAMKMNNVQLPVFAQSVRHFAKGGNKDQEEEELKALPLGEALANEIQAEAAEDEVDQEYEDIVNIMKKTFKTVEEVGNGTTILERTYKNEQIQIKFHCQDEEELDPTEEEMEATMQNEDEGGPEMAVGIKFEVTITKKDGEKMIVDCTAGRHLLVEGVRYIPAGKSEDDENLYNGPVFDQLDEGLVDSVYAYLDERKIDDDLCFFILSHSAHKEQKEYVNWLNKMLEFVEK